jgi:hypothetical protein
MKSLWDYLKIQLASLSIKVGCLRLAMALTERDSGTKIHQVLLERSLESGKLRLAQRAARALGRNLTQDERIRSLLAQCRRTRRPKSLTDTEKADLDQFLKTLG